PLQIRRRLRQDRTSRPVDHDQLFPRQRRQDRHPIHRQHTQAEVLAARGGLPQQVKVQEATAAGEARKTRRYRRPCFPGAGYCCCTSLCHSEQLPRRARNHKTKARTRISPPSSRHSTPGEPALEAHSTSSPPTRPGPSSGTPWSPAPTTEKPTSKTTFSHRSTRACHTASSPRSTTSTPTATRSSHYSTQTQPHATVCPITTAMHGSCVYARAKSSTSQHSSTASPSTTCSNESPRPHNRERLPEPTMS